MKKHNENESVIRYVLYWCHFKSILIQNEIWSWDLILAMLKSLECKYILVQLNSNNNVPVVDSSGSGGLIPIECLFILSFSSSKFLCKSLFDTHSDATYLKWNYSKNLTHLIWTTWYNTSFNEYSSCNGENHFNSEWQLIQQVPFIMVNEFSCKLNWSHVF